jgi:hypothetical protein
MSRTDTAVGVISASLDRVFAPPTDSDALAVWFRRTDDWPVRALRCASPAGPADWSWRTRTRRPRGKSAVDSDVVDTMGGHPVDARSCVGLRPSLPAEPFPTWAHRLSGYAIRLPCPRPAPTEPCQPGLRRCRRIVVIRGIEPAIRHLAGQGEVATSETSPLSIRTLMTAVKDRVTARGTSSPRHPR